MYYYIRIGAVQYFEVHYCRVHRSNVNKCLGKAKIIEVKHLSNSLHNNFVIQYFFICMHGPRDMTKNFLKDILPIFNKL